MMGGMIHAMNELRGIVMRAESKWTNIGTLRLAMVVKRNLDVTQ